MIELFRRPAKGARASALKSLAQGHATTVTTICGFVLIHLHTQDDTQYKYFLDLTKQEAIQLRDQLDKVIAEIGTKSTSVDQP